MQAPPSQDWRSSTQRQAASPATAPSPTAVVSWRTRLPAAVPRGEHAGQAGLAVLPGHDIAPFVQQEQVGEGAVAGLLAHGDKQGVHIQLPFLPGGPVPHPQAGEAAVPG